MKRHEQALIFFRKAKNDEDLVDAVLSVSSVSDEIIGFHCQQAAEKMLKAFLSHLGVKFERTHNLRNLMDLLSDNGQNIPPELADLDKLTPFGTLIRYEEPEFDVKLDRVSIRKSLVQLRAWVENGIKSSVKE